MARAWESLASDDAKLAFDAIRLLAAFPKQALPVLEAKMRTSPKPDAARTMQQMRSFDAPGLLASMLENLRIIRAVEAVEWMETQEAVKLLERWTAEPEGTRLGSEAKSALSRLKRIQMK
jgi:hypothetical protein